MIVYVDVVFLVNFLISFTFLLLIKFLLNGKESIKIILLCSCLSVLLLFSFFLNKFFYNLFKASGGFIVLSFTLYKRQILEKIIRTILYYSLQFSLVGLTNVFYIKGYILIICILILLISFVFYKYQKLVNKKNIFEKDIKMNINYKTIKMNAYLDSGNLSTYKANPIIYLDNKYFYFSKYLTKEKTLINTIEGLVEKEIYYLDNLLVGSKVYKNVYIAFGELNTYDCLLNVIMA